MRKSLVIALSCCVLALTSGLVACGASSSSVSTSSEDSAKAEYDRACALYDEGKYYSAKEAFEKSAYGDWEQRAAACVQPMPETSELFHDPDMVSDRMILNFVVEEADANEGTYISVYTKDKRLVETVFIKGTGTVETKLPGGEYYVKDASGSEWYGEDEQFGPGGDYESMVFNEVESDPYLTVLKEGYEWTITINSLGDTGRGVGFEEGSWDNR